MTNARIYSVFSAYLLRGHRYADAVKYTAICLYSTPEEITAAIQAERSNAIEAVLA